MLERNIPAYAGKTRRGFLNLLVNAEHPRVCGENSEGKFTVTVARGTSPRMRGKRKKLSLGLATLRNIPAYAGKTGVTEQLSRDSREHPRVCGENRGLLGQILYHGGTSPRMRGKPVPATNELTQLRNIPAYAGKTWWRRWKRTPETEHPRVCGENRVTLLPV